MADRSLPDAYRVVATEPWDAVIDVASQPGQVRRAVAALAGTSLSYCYISSASVYANTAQSAQDETAPTVAPLDSDIMPTPDTYGRAKVACEQHVLAAFGAERSLIVRAGLIGGPGDPTGRSTYWPTRFARPVAQDGRVLVPDPAGLSAQLINVRDLASWVVTCAEGRRAGTYNAVGHSVALADYFERAREVAGHRGPLVVAAADWLLARGVQAWMGERSLPLWLPMPEYAGFASWRNSAALEAGLDLRPLPDSIADTLAWSLRQQGEPMKGAGLPEDDERALLAELYRPV